MSEQSPKGTTEADTEDTVTSDPKSLRELGVTGKFKLVFDRLEKDLDANRVKIREATNSVKRRNAEIRAVIK